MYQNRVALSDVSLIDGRLKDVCALAYKRVLINSLTNHQSLMKSFFPLEQRAVFTQLYISRQRESES